MKLLPTTFVALALAFAGCKGYDNSEPKEEGKSASASESPAPVNKFCPITGKPVSATVRTSFMGETIGLCCPLCVTKWQELSDSEKSSALAKAKTKS